MLLAVAGGVAGVGVAFAILRLIESLIVSKAHLPAYVDVVLDLPALIFALGLSLTTGLFFGLVPALRSRSTELVDALRGGHKSSASPRQRRSRRMLVVAQIALAQLLLLGAALFVRTLIQLERADLGFESENVLSFELRLPHARYPERWW